MLPSEEEAIKIYLNKIAARFNLKIGFDNVMWGGCYCDPFIMNYPNKPYWLPRAIKHYGDSGIGLNLPALYGKTYGARQYRKPKDWQEGMVWVLLHEIGHHVYPTTEREHHDYDDMYAGKKQGYEGIRVEALADKFANYYIDHLDDLLRTGAPNNE